jgi:hypothetical protein
MGFTTAPEDWLVIRLAERSELWAGSSETLRRAQGYRPPTSAHHEKGNENPRLSPRWIVLREPRYLFKQFTAMNIVPLP